MRLIALLVCGVCVFCVICVSRFVVGLRADLRTAQLYADSIQAAQDSTRAVLVSTEVIADSVRVYQRRIIQVRQRSDSLDRALGLERAARYRVEAAVAVLQARGTAQTSLAEPATEDVRVGRFSIREPPYHIDAAVALPRPSGEGRIALRVALDTAVFEARVGCGPADQFGVRPAMLSLAGPRWVAVRLTRLEQAPRVCSPEEPSPPRLSLIGRLARGFHVGVGYSAVLAPDGRIVRGPGVNISWSPWP